MGKDEQRKNTLDELFSEVDQYIDPAKKAPPVERPIPERSQPPKPKASKPQPVAPKQPVAPPKPAMKKPAPPPPTRPNFDRPVPPPSAEDVEFLRQPKPPQKEQKEPEKTESKPEVTADRLKQVRAAYERAIANPPTKTKTPWLIIGFVAVSVISVIVYFGFFSMDNVQAPDMHVRQAISDPSLPLDSTTGDVFKEEREAYETAQKSLASGDFSGMEKLNKLKSESPNSPQAAKALLLMASTYRYNLNDTGKATEAYDEFLQRFPDHKRADVTRKYLIELLLNQGKKEEAIKHLEILSEKAKEESDRIWAQSYINYLQK